jgi:anaerobic ribonucleoside-triphosphate reductase activating protein
VRSSDIPSLQVGVWLSQSQVNGPGNRFVLWLQGCSLRCAGCCNPEFQAYDGGQRLTVKTLAAMILATAGIEGVTYSGGEPFEQAESLALLSGLCREAGLTVMAYSGLTYEALRGRADPHVQALLGMLDVLVDGPFELASAAALRWRGSRNQRIHLLTDHYHLSAADVQREMIELEFRIQGNNLAVTGTADDQRLRFLSEI